MGNPHAVAFLESEAAVDTLDLATVGPPIEERPHLPARRRTWSSGSRGAAHDVTDEDLGAWRRRDPRLGFRLLRRSGRSGEATNLAQSPVSVSMDGGVVEIEWSGDDEPVYMRAPPSTSAKESCCCGS